MPIKIIVIELTNKILLISNMTSRDQPLYSTLDCIAGPRSANNSSEPPITMAKKPRMKTPRSGSLAKACTEVRIPERTKKVPSKLSENAKIASNNVQLRKTPRFSVAAILCISAVPTNQGINDAFSTGSQNHQPPQPSS